MSGIIWYCDAPRKFHGKPPNSRERIISSATQTAAPASDHNVRRAQSPSPIFPARSQTQAAGIKREVGGQRNPAENWKTGHGHQQQPVKRREPEEKSGDVADVETFAAGFSTRAGEHERGRNPRASGNANVGKRGGEQKSGGNGGETAAADEKLVEKTFQRSESRIVPGESRAKPGAFRGLVHQRAAGIDDDGFARAAPDGKVGGRIAGVIEAAFTEYFHERLEFVPAAQVGFAVAAKNFIEEAGVIGNRFGHLQIGRGGENDFSPAIFLFAEKFQERFVEGQGGGINRDAPRELLLQERTPARPPEQNLKKAERILSEQPRERFPEQVSLDERAVQIHDERDLIFGRRRLRHGFD